MRAALRKILLVPTLAQRAIAILRRLGSNAHVLLPGIGTISGLTAGNYLDSALTTLATVDNPVGGVVAAVGTINATQATTANKPLLVRGLKNLLLNSATPATQSVTCTASPYTLALYGTGNVVLSGTGAGTLTGTGASDLVVLNFTPTAGSVTFTKAGTVSSFGLFTGTLTAAQIQAEGGIPLTTSAAASNPTAGKYSWSFDGTDSLALGSVPFQTSDEFFVIAGSNSPTSQATGLFSVSTGVSVAELITLAYSSGRAQIYMATGGNSADVIDPVTCYGSPVVMSGRKSGTTLTVRKNGVVRGTTSTSAVGASAFTVSKIGEYPGGIYTGNLGPVIYGKGTLSNSDLLTLERFIASLTPNAPTF